MNQATEDAFAKLTTTVERQSDALVALSKSVERGFSAVAEDIAASRAELKAEIADVRREMATKEQLRAFREETEKNFRDLRAEVADIRRIAEDLQARVGNTEGYSKEIDHLMARVRAIEKHLGIETKIAA